MSFNPDAEFYFLNSPIAAPIEITNNRPAFVSETVSLKRPSAVQEAQRWELSFRVTPGCHRQYAAHSVANLHSTFTMIMPQVCCAFGETPDLEGQLFEAGNLGDGHIVIKPNSADYTGWSFTLDGGDGTVYAVTGQTGTNSFTTGFNSGFLNSPAYSGDVLYITPNLTGNFPIDTIINWIPDIDILANATAGSSTVVIQGLDSEEGLGRFVTFSNHNKVYMVTAIAVDEQTITIYPDLQDAVTTADKCRVWDVTLQARYDSDVTLSGIRYIDGILADPGTVNIIEAL